MSQHAIAEQGAYRGRLLQGLLLASLIPGFISVLNFEILNQSAQLVAFLFSLLAILGGAHVWLTLTYYFDRRWIAHFQDAPLFFFVVPTVIVVACTLLLAQPNKAIGLLAVYGATIVNLWHHAKQNWGILSLVGKMRRANVVPARLPLIHAWPFFLAGWAMLLPELRNLVGAELLKQSAIASMVAYVLFVLWHILPAWKALVCDRLVAGLCFALLLYFTPIILLSNKPYALLVWAGAHGLQYYLMVFVSLSQHERRSASRQAMLASTVTALAGLGGLTLAAYLTNSATPADFWATPWARVVVGVVTGINLVHFWIDAFIWKFSDQKVQELHGDAFKF